MLRIVFADSTQEASCWKYTEGDYLSQPALPRIKGSPRGPTVGGLCARYCPAVLLALLLAAAALPATSNADEGPSSIVDVVDAFAPKPIEPLGLEAGDGTLTVVESALDRLAAARAIAPQPQNVFGESVDPMGRNLRFFQTDVLLRGIGPDIAISRSLDVNASRSTWWQREREFADP